MSLRGFASTSFRDLALTFRGFARISAEELEPQFPRLVERSLPYRQSRNKVHIRHRNSRKSLYQLLQYNWFHVFLRINTKISVFVLLVLWTLLILFFGWLYYAVDKASPKIYCGLADKNQGTNSISYLGAVGFALETGTTVGYSLPGSSNALFENCPGMIGVIYLQMMSFMMFNAFLFAFFFARIARSESRAIQVVFSDKCVVRETERGTLVWQFRVYDVEAGHGIVEAHVRLYALLRHKDAEGHPKMEQLRIVSPNDDLGAVLFLNIPTLVTHEMDYYSPLYGNDMFHHKCDAYRLSSGGLMLREVDSVTGNREEIMCPVCGETYGDFRRLRKHVRYNQMTEKKDEIPIKGSHQGLNINDIPKQPDQPSLIHIRNTLPLQELLCVVEGIDPLTSGTFQALHSYMPEDIEWGCRFLPCLTSTTALDATFVDLELFHQTKSVADDTDRTTPTSNTGSQGASTHRDNVQYFPPLQREESTKGDNEAMFSALRKVSKYGTIVEQV